MRPRLLVLYALCASPAAAQNLGIEDVPTRSVYQAGTGAADSAEPFGVVTNPASLGDLRDFTIGARYTHTFSDPLWTGAGAGLYLASPFPYVRRLQAGGALEVLSQGHNGWSGKLTLSLSYRALDFLSFGLSYAHVFAPMSLPHGDLDTVTLSTRVRAGRYFAAGLVLHDLNAPAGGRPGQPLPPPVPRTYELEVLLRPLGDDRLEVALGGRLGEARLDTEPRARLWFHPIRGLGIGADATILTGVPDRGYPYRVGIGLSLDLAHVGGSGFGLFGQGANDGTGAGPGAEGFSLAVRGSVAPYPSLADGHRVPGGPRLYRIEPGALTGIDYLKMLALLRQLEQDPGAAGVIAILGEMKGSWGKADELRAQFLRLRQAGKHVYVYAADLGTAAYYVASAAERIFLDPAGSLRLLGISVSTFYARQALDLLGIRAEILRVGSYKATPETFTQDGPSREATEEREAVVDDIFQRLVSAVSASRKLPRQSVLTLFDKGLFTPEVALSAGLIDRVATGDDIEAVLVHDLGPRLRLISPDVHAPDRRRHTSWSPPAIAIVNIEGDLVEGTSVPIPILPLKLAGGDTLQRTLDQAAQDPRVAAIVVRIDSPGGSALVADLLSRQIAQIARSKPVVCSFGDVAASGGYYLAAPCTLIFTNPSTVTGSIGIFGGKLDAQGLLMRLGIRHLPFTRGKHAAMDSYFHPYTEQERALTQEQLQHGYDRFLQVVGTGRHLTRQQVDAVAQGRIYTGAQTLDKKLCDHTGGLLDAVAAARKQADLAEGADVELLYYPRPDASLLSRLLGFVGNLNSPQEWSWKALQPLSAVLSGIPIAIHLLQANVLARMEASLPQ